MTTDQLFLDIYWANSFFNEADFQFNQRYVKLLRDRGYTVYLPQEALPNQGSGESSPTARDIFLLDTSQIMKSRLMVACIDQETIDCGVACEIGIAFSCGIPIIGLYTDLRQFRKGEGKMYKNIYIIGAIETIGEVVSNQEGLLESVQKYMNLTSASFLKSTEDGVVSHYNSKAPQYADFVARLESFYEPHWSAEELTIEKLKSFNAKHILEFGSATGSLAYYLQSRMKDISYIGYDGSLKMTALATSKKYGDNIIFTSEWKHVVADAKINPFDMAVCLFSLHDIENKETTISAISNTLKKNGHILIVDLSTHDLPELTHILSINLSTPLVKKDFRIDPVSISSIADKLGLIVDEFSCSLPQVVFPTEEDIDEYFEMFGIYDGMDLPLGIRDNPSNENRARIKSILSYQKYPFRAQRVFSICVLHKI